MSLFQPVIFATSCITLSVCQAEKMPEKMVDPIIEITEVAAEKSAYENSKFKQPVVLGDLESAKKYFKDESLKKIQKVDFTKQKLLIFAWKGSGQDKLSYVVAESFPEQIMFKATHGRTRDLRSHCKVFALRKNVTFSVK